MNEQNKNSKYTIWFYNLTAREYLILQSEFSSDYFDINDIFFDTSKLLNMRKLNLLDKPDLVITDIETSITSEIKDVLFESCCGLVTVSTKPFKTSIGNTFELTDEVIEIPVKKDGKFTSEILKKIDISIKGIIDICQMYNIQKLKKITTKNINDTLNLEIKKDFDSGEKSTAIAREYLFKMARIFNEYISLKDHYTAGHCERVAMYSEALGHALGMSNDELEDLILAANLHDIGKIALPDAVITKTTVLNDFERELLKMHVKFGVQILPTDKFGSIKSSIRGHHERYDGSGYPDGLKGEEIPYFARILAIADSFDAMTSQRTYNEVKTLEEAFIELINCTKPKGVGNGKGVFYDPKLVEKFIKVISSSKTIMDNFNKQNEKIDQNIGSSYQYKKEKRNHE